MMGPHRIWTVVPVKRFSAAKLRLTPILNAGERAELARIMFEDVLDTLKQCKDLVSEMIVVTSDSDAAASARCCGLAVVADEPESGINAAIMHAIDTIRPVADSGLMVIPSDIPQLSRSAIARGVAAIEKSPSLAIAEAADDGGTNLFALRPIGAVPPLFGQDSFARHRSAALQAGIPVQILRIPELSMDIDRPENLKTFLALGSRTRTHEFLSQIGVDERVAEYHDAVRRPLDQSVAEA
jgi:2-phospho-L-lactate/phosphoenolpyruvate guanylyltransferase